jgi:ribonuclease-3
MTSDLPYNPLNILLTVEDLKHIIQPYTDIPVSNIGLYRNAFVHKSYCTRKNENFANGNILCPQNCLPLQEESNERLEFLGDAVINLIIGNYLYIRFPDESEGFLTKVRTKLVNGNMLAELAKYAELNPFIIISKQIEDNRGRLNTKILEDTFEAFVGAMYLDLESQNLNATKMVGSWLISLIETNIDFVELLLTNSNYKDSFLKYYQHTHNHLPKFVEVSADSTSTGKRYKVAIKDKENTIIAMGTGPNKKAAENDASYNALVFLGQL